MKLLLKSLAFILLSCIVFVVVLFSRLRVDNVTTEIRHFEASVPLYTHHEIQARLSWTDPFCNDFFSNKFTIKMTPCEDRADRVACYGSPYDNKMGSCFMRRLAMNTTQFYHSMMHNKNNVVSSRSLWFTDGDFECLHPKFDLMEEKMVGGDYVKKLAQASIMTPSQGQCDNWIRGTTFIFMGFDVHIYFKYLSWFSLHNGILNHESETGEKPSLIIRIPELKGNFTHADYEQKLFPETKLMSLKDFSTENAAGIVCFEKMIVTPWAFSTNAFRCKMSDIVHKLRTRCYDCNGAGLDGTRFMSFRQRALSACSIEDAVDMKKAKTTINNIVLQVRKPYIRVPGDKLEKFSRIMVNSDEVVNGLKKSFPNATIRVMIAEDLSLCDQIKMVHDADVLLGVHGAGLVHLWWLQDHALLFEIVPSAQKSNPSFKMLSTLTGRRYYGYGRLKGSEKKIVVDVKDIVQELRKQF